MTLTYLAALAASCFLLPPEASACFQQSWHHETAVAGAVAPVPQLTGQALDVQLTAAAALAWDQSTGAVLYAKAADERRAAASLTKLLSALTVRHYLATDTVVTIPEDVRRVQRLGAHIRLPAGEHTTVADLLAAGLIASANDAMVALAVATAGSEEAFLPLMQEQATALGLTDTRVSNATGLSGGDQYSTARDIQRLFSRAYEDTFLRELLARDAGYLTTAEGTRRHYESTNQLIGTYVPVLAAKTGYTMEAGENLVVMTAEEAGQEVGAVVLGSQQRFQDMKVLLEWLWRNYTWAFP